MSAHFSVQDISPPWACLWPCFLTLPCDSLTFLFLFWWHQDDTKIAIFSPQTPEFWDYWHMSFCYVLVFLTPLSKMRFLLNLPSILNSVSSFSFPECDSHQFYPGFFPSSLPQPMSVSSAIIFLYICSPIHFHPWLL